MFIPNNVECYFDLSIIINTRNILIILLSILLSGLGSWILNKLKKKEKIIEFYKSYVEVLVIAILIFICIIMLASSTYNPFIYFRF